MTVTALTAATSDSEPRPRPRLAHRAGLSLASLRALTPTVQLPRYDVAALRVGILHVGCGAFHRAHQALFTQRAIEAECVATRQPPPWGIAAVSLRSTVVVDRLSSQQGLYTVVERGPQGSRAEVVGALREALHAQRDAERWASLVLDPQLRVVTLTVSESA